MKLNRFKRAIVTSGPTREWIDPVRFITNASSGKMGFCIANEVKKYVDELVYVHGPIGVEFSKPKEAYTIYTESTLQMCETMISELKEDTIIIMAAAPADFRPIKSAENKIKKQETSLVVEFTQNPDILLTIKKVVNERNLKNVVRVGFAAETENLDVFAKEKLERKGLSYIIGNYVSQNSGFGDRDSSVRIYSESGLQNEIGPESKESLATSITEFIFKNLTEK